jgi:hypothetical protein
MYRVEVHVVDDDQPMVDGDDPRTVKTFSVGSTYKKLDLAQKFALRISECANVNEPKWTGKGGK